MVITRNISVKKAMKHWAQTGAGRHGSDDVFEHAAV